MNIIIVINQMCSILLMVALGYICVKVKIINQDGSALISKLIVNIFNPAIIFSSVLSNSEGGTNQYVGLTFLVAGFFYAVIILLAKLITPFFSRERNERMIYELMFVFSNLGFMGIPIVNSMFGASNLIYVAIYILEYNILFYTYRAVLITKKPGEKLHVRDMKSLINPGTIACVITLLTFIVRPKFPDTISTTIKSIGNVTTPLAMMVIGFTMGLEIDVKKYFLQWKVYIFSAIKLIVIPVIAVWFMKWCGIPQIVSEISAIMLAMPVGSMPLLFSKEYHAGEKTCTSSIIVSTLLTLFTLPFVVFLYPYL